MDTIPNELKYTVNHEWVRNEGNGVYTVGLTRPAQNMLGAVVNVDLPAELDILNAGDECAAIESMKASTALFMPLSGEIVAINDDLDGQPELINTDPYTDGWLYQVLIHNENELNDLLNAQDYQEILNYDEDEYDEESSED